MLMPAETQSMAIKTLNPIIDRVLQQKVISFDDVHAIQQAVGQNATSDERAAVAGLRDAVTRGDVRIDSGPYMPASLTGDLDIIVRRTSDHWQSFASGVLTAVFSPGLAAFYISGYENPAYAPTALKVVVGILTAAVSPATAIVGAIYGATQVLKD